MAKEKTAPIFSGEAARQALLPALAPELARTRALLLKMKENPPQVLLLEGGDESLRQAMALWWAASLHCQAPVPAPPAGGETPGPCLSCPACLHIGAGLHLDVLIYDGRISNKDDEENPGPVRAFCMDNARALKARVGDAPHGPGPRVVILSGLNAAREAAANALLKVLEEPSPTTVFVLSTPQREQILPTLVSRSWAATLPWPAPDKPDPDMRPWETALAEFLEQGRGWWHITSAKGAVDQLQAQRMVLACQKALAAAMAGTAGNAPLAACFAALPPHGRMAASRLLEEAQEALGYNVSPPRALDWLATQLFALKAC